ncbi:hypothetical protein ACRYI5_07005 [Furfurilactobacillus sp. WILCCON 0119]
MAAEKLRASLTKEPKMRHDRQLGDYVITAMELGSGYFQFDVDSMTFNGNFVEAKRPDGTFATMLNNEERIIELQ